MDKPTEDPPVKESVLWEVLEELRAAGKDVQSVKARLGYYMIDGRVASAEVLIDEAQRRAR